MKVDLGLVWPKDERVFAAYTTGSFNAGGQIQVEPCTKRGHNQYKGPSTDRPPASFAGKLGFLSSRVSLQ